MKVLITGGAGFIGSNLVNRCIEQGWQVHVIDNLSKGRRDRVHANAAFYHMDIRDEGLEELFSNNRYDAVFHLAAQVGVQDSIIDPVLDANVNIIGTIKIASCCARYGAWLIYSSSAAVYGIPRYLPLDEIHPAEPISPYGISKKTSEMYIDFLGRSKGLKYTILRYSNVYGDGQDISAESGVITKFVAAIRQGGSLYIYGDGLQSRDFIYIDDVLTANLAILKERRQGTYNISTNQGTSIKDLASLLMKISSQESQVHYEDRMDGDIEHSILNNSRAITDLHWQPRFSLEEGLNRIVPSTGG